MNEPISLNRSTSRSPLRRGFIVWYSVIALALALPLLVNIVGRFKAEADMREAVTRISARSEASKVRLGQLQRALAYAKSAEYVERWARMQARWAKPGETPVLPVGGTLDSGPTQLWWEDFVTAPPAGTPNSDSPKP